jgi:hypothetical protein
MSLDTQDGIEDIVHHRGGDNWNLFGRDIPKFALAFFSQIIIIYLVIISCIINLTIGTPDSNLWVALLASALGYLLPCPTLR